MYQQTVIVTHYLIIKNKELLKLDVPAPSGFMANATMCAFRCWSEGDFLAFLDIEVQFRSWSISTNPTPNTSHTALSTTSLFDFLRIRHLHRPEKEALKQAVLSI